VDLPRADSLSLSETIDLVKKRCNCSDGDAKKAVRLAGLDGRLEASGSIPLSAHPNPTVRARHPASKREAIRAADWSCSINWDSGVIGCYSSVLIRRASLESWLDTGRDAQSAPTLKKALKSSIDKAIKEEYERAYTNNEKPPNLKEIVSPVQRALRAQGLEASGRQIQTLAEADEFKKLRRKAGATVKSEKRRQEP
jgi:hypothetical protein